MTSTYTLRMLVKHASIRTQAEADIMAQNKKYEGYVDQMDENLRTLLSTWRLDKSIKMDGATTSRLANMDAEERAEELMAKRDRMKSINSRDLASALVAMAEKDRAPIVKAVTDDRAAKQKVMIVVISGPFMKFFPCNHSVNINIIIFFFRRSKRQRNFSLFYFAS
jgi:hypothetical protein